jgi:ribonuclease R
MPVSSKKIIASIISKPYDFTRKELTDELIQPGFERHRKKGKKSHKPYSQEKYASLVEETLSGIVSAGLIKRKKNRYIKIHSFTLEGKIRINTTGNGIISFGENDIIIKKEDAGNARNNDLVSAGITDFRKGSFYGEVRDIIQRTRDVYFAKVIHVKHDMVLYNLIDSPGSLEVCSATSPDKLSPGDIALVKLEQDEIRGRQRCTVMNVFPPDDDSYDLTRIIMKHSLPPQHKNYPVLSNVQNLSHDSGPRKDYTRLFTITIDGEKAKDFDDAVSIERTNEGYTLYVHIADVSAYVRKDSELDREALSRGTSYYIGNSVIPMLPEVLSNDLCSLREGVDRLTLSVKMRIDNSGTIRGHDFKRGVIRVDRRLTYNTADEILNAGEKNPLYNALHAMYGLTTLLHANRIEHGSLELNITDESLIYENNVVTDIQYIERLKSHQIIEEFMLCANVAVSRSLRDKGIPSLFRNHEAMTPDSLLSLKKFLRQLNLRFKMTGNPAFNIQSVLHDISGTEFEHVVNMVILRSFMQAYYGASPEGHFGLGFKDYTHFTSPIRRYPDLVVHRCLKSLIDGARPPYSTEELILIGDKSSEMERVAQSAERDFVKIKSCRLMKERVGEIFKAIVSGVSRFGFYVTLIDMPIDGMVPLRALTDDYYIVREDEYTIVGKRHGRRFRIGDKITVRLVNVELERMIMDFDIA